MAWERSLLYQVDYLNDALVEGWAGLVYAWYLVGAYVTVLMTVRKRWGWYGLTHRQARHVPRHGGVGTRHRWEQPRLWGAESRKAVYSRGGNLYSVDLVLNLCRSDRGERLDSPGTVVFPRETVRARVRPIRPSELNDITNVGWSVIQDREAIAA